MKKLLILVLVLGLTSAANAALTWDMAQVDILVGDSAVVTIASDSDQPYTQVWAGNDPSPTGVAEITGIAVLPAAAEGTAVPHATWTGWWLLEAVDFTPPSDITAGDHFDVTIAGLVVGTYTLNTDYYGTAGANDTLLVNVYIPEPMTIALLGLGGLFLLRRRK